MNDPQKILSMACSSIRMTVAVSSRFRCHSRLTGKVARLTGKVGGGLTPIKSLIHSIMIQITNMIETELHGHTDVFHFDHGPHGVMI